MRALAFCCLAACTFSPQAPVEVTIALVDDSAEDFTAHTALLDGGEITPWGTIEPAAFVVGGLFGRAFAGNEIDDDDEFEDIVEKATTPLGTAYRQVPNALANGRPRGLGLPGGDNYTVIYDGEILLPLGVQKLELTADDRAVVQVAQDGATFGQRLFAHLGTTSITLDVRTPGWVPIRIAYAQESGPARLDLVIVQGQARTPVSADQLRAPVTTDHGGLIAFGFAGQALLFARGETAVPTIDAAYGFGAPPYDLDVGFDQFSLRHAGQLRIDAPGTYTFAADVGPDGDDQYRLWIDDALVASTWAGAPASPTGSVELTAGWHDLVFDYADNLGNSQVTLLVDDAPIASSQLRPAVARGLIATHVRPVDTPLADAATTTESLDLLAPSDAVIDNIDLGYGIRNHRRTDLTVEYTDCEGPHALTAASANPFFSFHYFSNDARCLGTAVVPPQAYQLRFVDAELGNDGILGPAYFSPLLVASYHGGERTPFARGVAFVSTPRPTPSARALVAARVIAEARGATITLSVRTADDEDALAATPWSVVAPGGKLPAAGELVQYQLAIAGDGWQYAVIDRVELEYVGLE